MQVLCGAYRRQPRLNGNCSGVNSGGMEAGRRPWHRTYSEPSKGFPERASVRANMKPSIRLYQDEGRDGGSDGKSVSLNPGELCESLHEG